MTAESVPIAQLSAYKNNPRTHSQTQIAQLARSLKKFGWTNPVLRSDAGVIIAGHGRIAAAKILVERGEKDFLEAPVITARGWSKDQIRAYVIADNQLALQAGWEPGLLAMELKELSGAGFDMGALGFGGAELSRLLGNTGGDAAEAAPPAPVKPVSRLGDLWKLGRHRVLCGDSTDAKAVGILLAGAKPPLMATDPPYGVEYDPNWRNSADRSTQIKGRKIGATAVGKVQNDDRANWQAAWALFPGDVAYVWHAGLHASEVDASLKAAGFEIRSQIIWNKSCHIIGRGDYHWKHEPCWYAVRKGKSGKFDRRERKQNTVWDIDHRASDSGHGTQKPVECMRRPIVNSSAEGDGIYDPFLGSGTTVIAAQMEGRVAYGLELDPGYVDVIVSRWNKFTGKEATLGGKTLDQVRAERHGQARTKAKTIKAGGGGRRKSKTPAPEKRAKPASAIVSAKAPVLA